MSNPKPAILPTSQESGHVTVEMMRVGQAGYIHRWVMEVDAENQCWLKAEYSVEPRPFDVFGSPVDLGIARRDDGYHVWMYPDERWSPRRELERLRHVPVTALHYWPPKATVQKRGWLNWGV